MDYSEKRGKKREESDWVFDRSFGFNFDFGAFLSRVAFERRSGQRRCFASLASPRGGKLISLLRVGPAVQL